MKSLDLLKDKLAVDHLRILSSVLSDGIIFPEKKVTATASSAAIFIPKKYAGHIYRIILVPENPKEFRRANALAERDSKIKKMDTRIKHLTTLMEKMKKTNQDAEELSIESSNEENESKEEELEEVYWSN